MADRYLHALLASANVIALVGLAAWLAAASLPPQRAWLERLALVIPSPGMTRWLLLVDLTCLVVIGLAHRRRQVGIPLALAVGFVALNVLGMLLNDFYLGMAAFHVAAGAGAATLGGRRRWIGVSAIILAVLLGLAT